MKTKNAELGSASGRLLWLGAGSLAEGFADLTEAGRWREITAARRNVTKLSHRFTPLAVDFSNLQSTQQLVVWPAEAVVVSLTPPARSDEGYYRGYVLVSQHIIAALRRWPQPPKRVIWVSSTSVYGQNQGQQVDENSPTEPVGFSGQRLLEAEHLWRSSGLPVTVVRFSGIYGPGRNRLLQQVLAGKLGAEVPAYTNRIHQQDCCRVIAHLLCDAVTPGVYIGTDDCSVVDREVRTWLAERMGVAAAACAEPEPQYTGKQLSNTKLKATGFEFTYPSFRQGYPAIISAYLAAK